MARQIVVDCLVMAQRMSRDLALGGIFQLFLFFLDEGYNGSGMRDRICVENSVGLKPPRC